MYALQLVWGRCKHGVRRSPTSMEWVTDPNAGPSDSGFSPRGLLSPEPGRLIEVDVPEYREVSNEPVEDRFEIASPDDFIVLRFLNARSGEQMEHFLSRFGFPKEVRGGVALEKWLQLDQSRLGRLLLEAGSGRPIWAVPKINEALATHDLSLPPAPWLPPMSGPVKSPVPPELRRGPDSAWEPLRLLPSLDYGPGAGAPRLVLRSPSLYDHMTMECVMVAVDGITARECDHCGNFYLSGHRTGRRAVGKYCSDRCRVAALRKRRANQATA